MSIFQGILLGLVQGVAEFLPISSSGHLRLVQDFLGLGQVPLLFDVSLHLATLAAVVLFFRKRIWELLCSFAGIVFCHRRATGKVSESDGATVGGIRAREERGRRYILAIVLTTVVTGAIGIVVEKGLDGLPIQAVGAGFFFTAVLLVLSAILERRAKPAPENAQKDCAPSWKQALFIGLAQGIGTLPGVSRSGSTISGALMCNVTREVAGEFSFIASIPVILGAFLLELKDLDKVTSGIGLVPVIAGCLTAFASGLLALALLMKIIKKGKLAWFAIYLVPLSVLVFLLY